MTAAVLSNKLINSYILASDIHSDQIYRMILPFFLFALLTTVSAKNVWINEGMNLPQLPNGQRYHEGDMVLNEEQYDWLSSPIQERKGKDNKIFLWPDAVVPFRLDKSSERDQKSILNGIRLWSDSTCLKFTQLNTTIKSAHLIFKNARGCFSTVGRSAWENGQTVSIGAGCLTRGTIAHEVGHAIGLYHEQSRPDRDDYVVVLKDNIDVTEKYNFDIETDVNDFGIPYDITSIMHYDIDNFSDNGKNTLVPRDIFKTFNLGQRNQLSFADIKLVNLMYDCGAKCADQPKCLNDGYRDKNCRCKCPRRYFGDLCEEYLDYPPVPEFCKENITSPTTISSPNHPNKYPEESKCIWLIQAPKGKKVKATFTAFDLEERQISSNRCTWDYVEVRAKDMYDGDKFCSKELVNSQVTSTDNFMVLLFRTTLDSHTGFKANIEFL